jgi:hypothetical protein
LIYSLFVVLLKTGNGSADMILANKKKDLLIVLSDEI